MKLKSVLINPADGREKSKFQPWSLHKTHNRFIESLLEAVD